jgi:hypothetical protein
MADYTIDRSRLEMLSNEQIIKALEEDRDDYTDQAIEVFEEILMSRGVILESISDNSIPGQISRQRRRPANSSWAVGTPRDAAAVLNSLLDELLNGKVDPPTAQAASNIVMGILRALELDYMSETEGE